MGYSVWTVLFLSVVRDASFLLLSTDRSPPYCFQPQYWVKLVRPIPQMEEVDI